jgi:hypothetical protein
MDALHGPAVRLGCFHDEALLRAYEYRCGMAVMDARLHGAGRGHFGLLDDQFAESRRSGRP